jgi:hypothetical protein
MRDFGKFFFWAHVGLGLTTLTWAQSQDLQQYIGSLDKIPAGEALNRALKTSSLTDHGSPFHAVLSISQPGNSDSPYEGTVEVYWKDASEYRVEVTSKKFQQIRIVNGDKIEDQDTGDFYPAWLRNYARAITDPLPRAQEFRNDKSPVMLGANISQSCVTRDDRTNGITDMMTWAEICFQGNEPRIKSAIDFTYFMEFGDYQPFGDKLIARSYTSYTDDNEKVIGGLTKLEPLNPSDEKLLIVGHPTSPEQRIETSFVSMAMNQSLLAEAPVIEWPPLHEGKTEGNMIVHVITDRSGQVREAYKHNSDNPGTEDFGVLQTLKYKFKPLLVDGVPVQMETPLVLHFKTQIGDAIPIITGQDIDKFVSGCGYNPKLPKGLLPSGTSFTIRVSVNEQGKDTGEVFPSGIPWSVVQKAKLHPESCRFKPYLVNGQPWYHHIDFVFTAP